MRTARIAISAVCTAFFVTLLACGGGGTMTNVMGRAGNAPLNVTIGDAPTDSVVAFEITVTSIVLTGGGTSVTVLSKPTEIELTHLSGTVEPLAVLNVPGGTYTGATITLSSAEATVLNGSGVPVQAAVNLPQTTINVPINLTVSGAASTLNFDLNLTQSLSVNLATNPPTVVVTPTFTASAATNPPQEQQGPENGEIEDVTGTVTATTSNSFTIAVDQQTFTFSVDSNTHFEGLTGLSALLNGMVVEVDGVTQSSGNLLATKVDVEEDENGLEVEGLVSSVTGNPATAITLVVHDESSVSSQVPQIGSNITVDVSGAQYALSTRADLTGLVLTFDASHIAPGQSVEVDAATAATDHVVASTVKLQDQGLRGTITGPITPFGSNGSQFTLTLASDSAFALLTGQTTITVFRQPSTELANNVSVNTGANVLVRGPLFFDGTAYTLVAARIALPQ